MRNFLQTNVVFLLVTVLVFGCSPLYHPAFALQQDPTGEQEALGDEGDLSLGLSDKQQVIFHGKTQSKKIAITFDDGPDNHYTVKILDILKKHQVPATFFVLGKLTHKYPWVLQRMIREGHTVGNHSWSHADFTKLNKREITQQLKMTNQEIKRWTGKKPLFFRPPFGAINHAVVDQVSEQGYSVIYWNVDTKDWQGRSATKILQIVKKNTRAGSIILFHSAGGQHRLQGTIQVLPQLISFLKKQGYQLVTIDQLVDRSAYRSEK